MQTFFPCFTKQDSLMGRSTIQSPPLQLVFPALTISHTLYLSQTRKYTQHIHMHIFFSYTLSSRLTFSNPHTFPICMISHSFFQINILTLHEPLITHIVSKQFLLEKCYKPDLNKFRQNKLEQWSVRFPRWPLKQYLQ